MSRYIVTGGAGRLGRSVVAAIAHAGHEVISVDRTTSEGIPADQIVLDLADAQATRELFMALKPDGVVHLAAIAVPFSSPETEIFTTNTALAFGVLDATLAAGAQSLLIASSPTVIGYGSPGGWHPSYLPIDEEHPRAPWNAYALSKVAIEELVAMAVRVHGHRLRVGTFRPCYVIAPEEWAGAPTQQGHTVRERLDDPALAAPALFNYLDARDGGEFVLAWLEASDRIENGSTFFVGASDSLSRQPIGEALTAWVPGLTERDDKLDPYAAAFSSARAERLLGWRALRSWRTELGSEPNENIGAMPSKKEAFHA